MKKAIKVLGVVTAAVIAIMPMAACSGAREHTHRWGEWQRNKTEHWRTCTVQGCTEERRGTHEDRVCDDCAAFRAVAFGVVTLPFDEAHVDFALEANEWFAEAGKANGFIYEFTDDFGKLNDEFLAEYDLIMFLNNKPSNEDQRAAFRRYMENGGAWIGYHACAFAESSDEWEWYHEDFLGSGAFRTNTWNPTAETLKVDTHEHFSTKNLPDTFLSTPNEWYGWQHDLRKNSDITVLLSLDESTFPAGDKPGEMWYGGDYPVAWSNDSFNMIYVNMGHNLMYYNTYEKQSETFGSETQNRFILDAMFGLTK